MGQGRRLRAPHPNLPAPTGLRCLSQRRPRRRTPGSGSRCPRALTPAHRARTTDWCLLGPPVPSAAPLLHVGTPGSVPRATSHHSDPVPTVEALSPPPLAPSPLPQHCPHGPIPVATSAPLGHGFMSPIPHPCPTNPPVPTVSSPSSQPPCSPYPVVPMSLPRPSARPAATLSRGSVRAKVSAVKPGWHDAARWHSRCPLCPERDVSTGQGPEKGPAAPSRVSAGSQAGSCRPIPWLTWSRSKRRQSGIEQPARRPMAGAGWCRRDRALPPRSRRCVRSPPGPSLQVLTLPRTAPSRPDGRRSHPARTRNPGTPDARYPPRYWYGTFPTVPGTVVPLLPLQPLLAPVPHQPPVPSTHLVLCLSRLPPAPRGASHASSLQGSGSRGCWWVTRARSTPGCPHATAPHISALQRGTNIILRDPRAGRAAQDAAVPGFPHTPLSQSTAQLGVTLWQETPGIPSTISCPHPMSGADPGASGRPRELRILPGPKAAVPTFASTHGHLRGLGWQPGGSRVLAAQVRRDLAPGMPNATHFTPMKDRQCPAHAHQHPLGGMGTSLHG